MAIWQAMKGDSQNPKRSWNHRDLDHQHFTESTGRRYENSVRKGDLMLIYFPGPGNMVYMGLQRAAESGPHKLLPSTPGADLWPWGIRVEGHHWIPFRRRGVDLQESKIYFPSRPQVVRFGLALVDDWGPVSSIQALIEEIQKRAEDPSNWGITKGRPKPL